MNKGDIWRRNIQGGNVGEVDGLKKGLCCRVADLEVLFGYIKRDKVRVRKYHRIRGDRPWDRRSVGDNLACPIDEETCS